MIGVYATPYEIKEYLKGTKNADLHPKDNVRIANFAIQMSRKFDAHTHRWFLPRRMTRLYDHPNGNNCYVSSSSYPSQFVPTSSQSHLIGVDELKLDADLLAVETFTTQNGNETITSGNYFLVTGDNYNYPPYDRIQLKLDGSQTTLSFSGTPQQANSVTGLWGFHDDYSNAFQQVDQVQDNPLTSSATTLTVADANGTDEDGLTPRFQELQIIRFGTGNTAEMAYITALDYDANTLTIRRGVNGSTAAEQALNTDIYVYRPMAEIQHAMLTLAAWAYRRKDSVGSDVDTPIATPTGVVIMPSMLPGEVKAMLGIYVRQDRL